MKLHFIPAKDVSIHAPARGATPSLTSLLRLVRCFNPRAREGRDIRHGVNVSKSYVSIHAPARGATDRHGVYLSERRFQSTRPRGARLAANGVGDRRVRVSIHAPARGATCVVWRERAVEKGFNPRAREGRDHFHAQFRARGGGFQSTRPRGARLGFDKESDELKMFQSTRPRGARRRAGVPVAPAQRFNPRAREGRDAFQFEFGAFADDVSIHAPARGATTFISTGRNSIAFQSTRPRGARRTSLYLQRRRQRFNPRAREGRDRCVFVTFADPKSFNPRAREGRDISPADFRCAHAGFNPRAREGRDNALTSCGA